MMSHGIRLIDESDYFKRGATAQMNGANYLLPHTVSGHSLALQLWPDVANCQHQYVEVEDMTMAVFKDYNTELKALQQRQRILRHKHVQQLGELVMATRADALDPETLAGMLLAAVSADKAERSVWQSAGTRFLAGRTRARRKVTNDSGGTETGTPGAKPGDAKASAD